VSEISPEVAHRLNNLLARILAAAESALHQPLEPLVRSELETIAGLVGTTAEAIRDASTAGRPPPGPRTDVPTI
jgi:signal transduction histidine kinase